MDSKKPSQEDNLYDPKATNPEKSHALGEIKIPIIEEKAVVGKTTVETGRVRIKKTVEEYEETVTVPLIEENVSVERKPINEYVEQAPDVRQEGGTTIYPVVKEVLVVEKRLMLVEEIHITKRNKINVSDESVTLRKERIDVERENIEED